MIISRTPMRISLGGGGTDLPSYYSRFGGFFVSAAIDQYMYIALHNTFQRTYIVKYSRLERAKEISEIQHPIVREAFKLHAMPPYIEMVSMADIPAGTGLGSSGSFSVGLLRAIYAMKREHVTPQQLAEEASRIEIDILGEPVGKQDTYIGAFGGLTCFEVAKDGQVTVTPLKISKDALHDLDDNLLMFFTGYSRSAGEVLSDQKARTEQDDAKMIEGLHRVKELGREIKAKLEAGDTAAFAKLMHEHWVAKRDRSPGMANSEINRLYEVGFANGALGGKLVGAGGGGFLLFYASDRRALRKAMLAQGLNEVRFSFDFEGSKMLVQT